jgi:hypothetical protein
MTDKSTPSSDEQIEATPASSHTTETGSIRKKSSFGRTMYYIDTTRQRLPKGPNQMMGIVKWMLDNKITSANKAMQGSEIGTRAIEDGYVVTAKLTGPVIFAYYIRRMEREQGVEHAATLHAKTGKKMA